MHKETKIREKKTIINDQRMECQLMGNQGSQKDERINGTQSTIKSNRKQTSSAEEITVYTEFIIIQFIIIRN